MHGFFMPSTRVFAPEGVPICETTERGMHTYGRTGERPIDTIHPTFYYPDFLIERLGGPDKIIEFMRYVGDTFLSVGHRAKKDWAWFLSNHTTLPELERMLGDAAAPSLRTLFAPSPADKPRANATAKQLLEELFATRPNEVAAVRAALGVPAERLSEYRLTESLYARFGSRDEMLAALASSTALQRLYLDFLLYTKNVVFKPEYAELLFGPRTAA